MVSIFVAAGPDEKAFLETASDILRRHYTTLDLRGNKLHIPGSPPQLVICDAQSFTEIDSHQAILLLRHAAGQLPKLPDGGTGVVVVDSGDAISVELASGTKLPAITCGLSCRDTITLSSMGEDSAVINLQRSVDCFDGTVAEPQEIPIRLGTRIDSYTLMAIACIFILCGDIQDLAHIQI